MDFSRNHARSLHRKASSESVIDSSSKIFTRIPPGISPRTLSIIFPDIPSSDLSLFSFRGFSKDSFKNSSRKKSIRILANMPPSISPGVTLEQSFKGLLQTFHQKFLHRFLQGYMQEYYQVVLFRAPWIPQRFAQGIPT